MKRLLYIIIGVLTLAATACSDIAESERLIYVPLVEDVPTEGVVRNILIEDFTGQDCPNCPTATNIISQLKQAYRQRIVPVAIHSGPTSVLPSVHPEGLATALGNDYYKHWGIEVQPSGVISRSDGVLSYTEWIAKTKYEVEQRPLSPIDISIASEYNEADGTASVTVSVTAIKDSSATGRLQLWLTEDSITAYQEMPSGRKNTSYLHHHVLRSAINGAWGEEVNVNNGATQRLEHDVQLSASWQPEQLSIVAFVYNDGGVVQVVSQRLIPRDGDDTPPSVDEPDEPDNPDGPDQPEPSPFTFQFVDASGKVVADGSTVVINKLEDGQMNTNLYIRNTRDEKAAGVMKCDISAMPGGTFSSCAFGQCLTPWMQAGVYDSYKSIIYPGTEAQPILTEWIPQAYGEWEATLQLCRVDIVSQTLFGTTLERAGDTILEEGPKITVRFVYNEASVQE